MLRCNCLIGMSQLFWGLSSLRCTPACAPRSEAIDHSSSLKCDLICSNLIIGFSSPQSDDVVPHYGHRNFAHCALRADFLSLKQDNFHNFALIAWMHFTNHEHIHSKSVQLIRHTFRVDYICMDRLTKCAHASKNNFNRINADLLAWLWVCRVLCEAGRTEEDVSASGGTKFFTFCFEKSEMFCFTLVVWFSLLSPDIICEKKEHWEKNSDNWLIWGDCVFYFKISFDDRCFSPYNSSSSTIPAGGIWWIAAWKSLWLTPPYWDIYIFLSGDGLTTSTHPLTIVSVGIALCENPVTHASSNRDSLDSVFVPSTMLKHLFLVFLLPANPNSPN